MYHFLSSGFINFFSDACKSKDVFRKLSMKFGEDIDDISLQIKILNLCFISSVMYTTADYNCS